MSEEEKPKRRKAGAVKKRTWKPAPAVVAATKADASITDHPMKRYASRYDVTESPEIPFWLSTGCASLDCAISKGKGLPSGMRLVLFRGGENVGKTITLLNCAAQAQGAGGSVLWIDGKRGLNPNNAGLCGVDITNPDTFRYHVPGDLEEALQYILDFCEDLSCCEPELVDKFPMLVVLDELANLEPAPNDTDKKLGMRSKNKPMNVAAFLTRGRALKHYATCRVDLTTGKLDYYLSDAEKEGIDSEFPLGEVIQYKTSKNNLAPPKRTAALPWFFHLGSDDVLGQIVWLKNNNYISYAGGWTFQGNKLPTLQDWVNYFYQSPEAKAWLKEYFTAAYLARSNYAASEHFNGGVDDNGV